MEMMIAAIYCNNKKIYKSKKIIRRRGKNAFETVNKQEVLVQYNFK